MSHVEVRGLSVTVAETRVCQNLNVTIKPGEVWSVLGRNGVGKTTLLHTLAGLAPCASGSVAIDDVDISRLSGRARAQQIGILFQHSDDLSSLTGYDLLVNARHPWIGRWRGVERKDEQIIERVVRDHAIAHLIDQQFGVLSGGERRRIELAALAVQDTRVVLLDEPVNHLDLHFQIQLLTDLLRQWRTQKKVVVMVMHDLNLATRFSDHLLCLLGDGESLSGPTEVVANEENFSRLIGHPIRQHVADGRTLFFPG